MGLSLEDKKAIVAEVASVAASAHSAIAAEYRGLTVASLTKLRAEARKNGVYVRVVKNTLARRAVQGTSFECMQDGFVGPMVLAFSLQDPGAAARVVQSFSKDNDKLVVKLVALGGKLLTPADLKAVANLPTRDQAISQLMAVLKAPVQKLVSTMAGVPSKLVRTLAAIKEQKDAA